MSFSFDVQAKKPPRYFTAQAVVHISDTEAGTIRVECPLPAGYSADDLREHLCLELPGETSLLRPLEVVQGNDHCIVRFFSADVANAHHLPTKCVVVWDGPQGQKTSLKSVAVKSAIEAAESDVDDDVEFAGSLGAGYPRTVGFLAYVAIIVGAMICGLFLLLYA